jgi:hypothetical protein
MSVPTQLKYNNKSNSAYARSYTSNILPQQAGPYTAGSTINIHIPCTNNTVLAGSESMLKFTLSVTSAANANNCLRLGAAGAHGCIQRLRLWHGSNLIEDLDNYGLLVGKMNALQQSGDSCSGKMNIMSGTSASYVNGTSVRKMVAGERLNGYAAVANGGVVTQTYCLNLMSIVGSLSSKYIPLYAMSQSGVPLRLEIQLVSASSLFVNSTVDLGAFSLSNVEYVAEYVELGADAMATVTSFSGPQTQFSVTGYRNYAYVNTLIANASTQINFAVPAKFASLKSLFLTTRSKHTGAVTYHANGSNLFSLASYNVRIGSRVVPAQAPRSVAEFFVEVLKAIGSPSDLNQCCWVDRDSYAQAAPVVNADTDVLATISSLEPQFMIGLDCESYSGASSDAIYQGLNTSTEDVYWVLDYTTPGNANIVVRFDTFAMFDQLIVIQDGLMMAQY